MIRVLIIAEVRVYRDGLARQLAADRRFAVVGAIAPRDGPEAVADAVVPDVVLLDAATPRGVELAARLCQRAPAAKLIAFALAETEHGVLAWAEAGASGYVPGEASVEQLMEVIEGSARGEFHCAPHIAARLLRRLAELATSTTATDPAAARGQLTPRERDILQLVGRGLSNRQIAGELGIELPTVKNHMHNVFEKLNLHRRAEVMLWMRRHPLARDADAPPAHARR